MKSKFSMTTSELNHYYTEHNMVLNLVLPDCYFMHFDKFQVEYLDGKKWKIKEFKKIYKLEHFIRCYFVDHPKDKSRYVNIFAFKNNKVFYPYGATLLYVDEYPQDTKRINSLYRHAND